MVYTALDGHVTEKIVPMLQYLINKRPELIYELTEVCFPSVIDLLDYCIIIRRMDRVFIISLLHLTIKK